MRNNNITELDMGTSIIQILTSNQIVTIEDVCKTNRKELKKIGLKDSDIKKIMIQLQLNGLDLNKRR